MEEKASVIANVISIAKTYLLSALSARIPVLCSSRILTIPLAED
jgi:hypothetical protein